MFKIGQEVVCIRKNNTPFHKALELNKVYTVLDVVYCSKCGRQSIHVGIISEPNVRRQLTCSDCSNPMFIVESNSKVFHSETRFAPLDEMEAVNKAIEELLRDSELVIK